MQSSLYTHVLFIPRVQTRDHVIASSPIESIVHLARNVTVAILAIHTQASATLQALALSR